MKTNIYNILIIFLMAAFLAACTSGVKLGEADDGTTIEVKTGDIIQVSLPGNISTGYNWVVDEDSLSILSQEGEAEFDSDQPNLVGSGGMITLKFKASSAGQETLHLDYCRPWEPETTIEGEYEVTVVVK